ncbi:TetR family transcriptional regulator [Colwellia sp. PAMC 20917]|uniref:TetR family transcriptional regulator n=1 Tax=Colwellia sp. PAMC 20917 TaxID=1816218 RepID=UPI0008783A94|nr:TetR family transcriptional regulator [Colwellia sp. PAMC 20917]AOW77218.1 TetR family transcriptional regulator [Colwellia sp. PAMC 20917]AOW78379.1 TetR family transcriptional regulator [Colwellia sp. PAMC 20917]
MTNPVKESKAHKAVRMAIIRIEKGRPNVVDKKRKISVSSVAEEAGVTRNTINRDCPDLHTRIQGLMNKEVREQLKLKQIELNKFKERNKDLRHEVEELKTMLSVKQSKNATLMQKNGRLNAQKAKNSNVVTLM